MLSLAHLVFCLSKMAGSSPEKNGQVEPDEEDVYGFAKFTLHSGLTYLGGPIISIPVMRDVDPMVHLQNIRALKIRNDDVFIYAFPKSGTHWIWEVTKMLMNKNTQYASMKKEGNMLEFCYPSDLEAEQSPRVLNSHLWMNHMPQELISKKSKIIHVVRNPKDLVVSYYYHLKQYCKKPTTFGDMVKLYMAKRFAFETQFDFLRQFDEFLAKHPDHPVMLIYYEDMKRNPLKITKDLAHFLGIQVSDSLCEEVIEACTLDKMKIVDSKRGAPSHLNQLTVEMFRKGVIGDWKNNFTVAQNEEFEKYIAQETAKGLNYNFIYE